MNIYDKAVSIVKKLVENGYTAYFAGGWVRDHVMGHDSNDIDIATNASPNEILNLFPKTLQVGIAFGVVIVIIDSHQFEVATFRKDIDYSDGRKPESVEYCNPKEDALRRDFTINGLFYDPLNHEIFDFVNGVKDIKEGVIQTIGSPHERFVEDRLRMVRAFRFAARFGFFIDSETQQAIFENAETLFPSVSMERIWQEFNKMAKSPRFDAAIIEMHRLNLLPIIFPQLKGSHLNDIKKCVLYFQHFPENTPTILYLAQLFPDATNNDIRNLCRYLHTSRRDINYVDTYFTAKDLIAKEDKENGKFDATSWVRYFARNDAILCLEAVTANYEEAKRNTFLKQHKQRIQDLYPHINRIVTKKPLVSGKLLLDMGFKAGEKIGDLLDIAEKYAINNDIHETKSVLEHLKTTKLWQELSS
ncbi:MAG: CCA tRNA nucleotidyltransferase [Chlamydiota bacterium]|nr:CCA tRNA nucleotidyltransferase [Chlamydiota bacterium]